MPCGHIDALLSILVGMQVFGLFAVMATATGCLFFLDTNTITQHSSLNPVGVLLLLLNVGYIALMAVLITKQGARHVRGWITWFKDSGQTTAAAARKWVSCCCRRSAKRNHGTQTAQAPAKSTQLSDMHFARTLSRRLSWKVGTADFLPEGNTSSTRDTY